MTGSGPPDSSARDGGVPVRRPLLVFGLRNPTSRYAETRHNAGAMALQRLARRHDLTFAPRTNGATISRGDISGTDVRLVLPGTYMNASGDAIAPMIRRFGRRLNDVLVVYDEMDLDLGVIRLRPNGSAGGHNGMRSVIEALGTDEFPRLRIGIGRPPRGEGDSIRYVLSRFLPDEKKALDEALERVADCIEMIAGEGIERAMNTFN